MVMESTTLSMIHRSECPNEKKGASESWAKKLPKDKKTEERQTARKDETTNPKRKEDKQTKPQTNTKQTSQQETLV